MLVQRRGANCLLLLSFTLFLITACTPKLDRYFLSGEELILQEKEERETRTVQLGGREIQLGGASNASCNAVENYIPDLNHLDHYPDYQLRVNFHIIDTKDRAYNYSDLEGIKMVESMLYSANKDLRENNALFLPYKNELPVLPIGYQMVLTPNADIPGDKGVYFHQDDELAFYIHKGKNRNLGDQRILRKYSIGADSIFNIFIMPHHPDSVLSSTYHPGGVGVYLGSGIKMAGMIEQNKEGWAHRGVLNHEIGHALGLQHAWLRDGCEDTPRHNNECWNRTGNAPCDTAASNNIMDYNAYQNAWSPCQIGRVRRSLASLRSRHRKHLVPFWNRLDTSKNIVITDSIIWNSAKDLKGHLILAEGAQLQLSCRLGMPVNGKIIVSPGAILRLDRAQIHHPGALQWQGIEILKRGKEKGEVIVLQESKIEDVIHEITLN